MVEKLEPGSRSERFRTAITAFIAARRDAKLKDAEDSGNAAKYEYTTWLSDAARRVGQIQAVTHVLKATHPDARGSSLHAAPTSLQPHREIGTHVLGNDFAEDVVGNAAALDVFKFLKIEVDGRRLLDWMQSDDPDLLCALSNEESTAREWTKAFSSLIRKDLTPESHALAKQVYWLVGSNPGDDSHYHLLQPLFSSSLADKIHASINATRFGEPSKLARQAYRSGEPHAATYSEYHNLVARKLGGTKPQNISQLNSERRGVNYLLSSLPPPAWRREGLPHILDRESALDSFISFEGVTKSLENLIVVLQSNSNTKEVRDRRGLIDQALGLQLGAFGAYMRSHLEPGWTRDDRCKLSHSEQLWLDPGRIELPLREEHREEDEYFISSYHEAAWPDEVASRFANWLNERLRRAGIVLVGDTEHGHWASRAIIDAAWPAPMQRKAAGAIA